MASVFPLGRGAYNFGSAVAAPRLARSMSMHVSAAILIFAALQLWGVVVLSSMPGSRPLPFVALALLLLAAIPFAKAQERRWKRLADTALPSSTLVREYRRDRSRLWTLTLIAPALWLGSFAAAARASQIF